MKHSNQLTPQAVCLGLLILMTPAYADNDPLNPPRGMFQDEWYAVMLAGKKCGQMRTRMDRIENGGTDLIVTQTKMRMRMRRDGVEVGIAVHNKTTETLDGQPRSFSRTTYLGQQPVTTEGIIADGKVTITSSQFGQKLPPKTFELPAGALMDWGAYREQSKRKFKPGTQYELPLYEPSLSPDRLCPSEIEILTPETVDLFGRKVEATKIRQTMHIPSRLTGNTTQ